MKLSHAIGQPVQWAIFNGRHFDSFSKTQVKLISLMMTRDHWVSQLFIPGSQLNILYDSLRRPIKEFYIPNIAFLSPSPQVKC